MHHETQFGEVPGSEDAGLSVPASLMDSDWCGLSWTPWAPLEREVIRQNAPERWLGSIGSAAKGMGLRG